MSVGAVETHTKSAHRRHGSHRRATHVSDRAVASRPPAVASTHTVGDTETMLAPPVAARHAVTPGAALSEEIRDSLRLLGGCVGATVAVALLLHLLAVWAG